MKMKLGAFITEEAYEQLVNEAVEDFSRRVASKTASKKMPEMRAMYNAVLDHGPIGYREVAKILGTERVWFISQRLGYLESLGLLRQEGVSEPSWNNLRHKLYVVARPYKYDGVELARQLLYHRVASLDRKRIRGFCVMNRLEKIAGKGPVPEDIDRVRDVMLMRAAGQTLKQIGQHYRITRERVRQIIEECLVP